MRSDGHVEKTTITRERAESGSGLPQSTSHATGNATSKPQQSSLLDELLPGARIGRYEVLEKIGAGGMGTVYAARDPELDRNVAVKVVRSDRARTARSKTHQARLLREARAMASLSHPNVITVYDVGAYGEDGVFLAMELIAGLPLSLWWAARRRTWRELVTVIAKAGRGLAAAHAAGLVHRDFKPRNILVGDDGRVRVLDFGLARAERGDSDDDVNTEEAAPQPPSLDDESSLTEPGALLGTPGYMSPEQFANQVATAASDQFSFCVTLYEGLYGRRPFPNGNIASLLEAIQEGRVAEPSHSGRGRAGENVPAWLRQVIVRGLAPDPDDRWPSMSALLHKLSQDPVRRRRRQVIGVAVIACVVALGFAGQRWVRDAERHATAADQRRAAAEAERQRAHEQLEIEARRARDALRMALAQQYRDDDPTTALALLREVEEPDAIPTWTRTAIQVLRGGVAHAVLRGHEGAINMARLSPQGDRAVTASSDRTARIWDLAQETSTPLIGHEGPVQAAEWSPGADRVVTASTDGTARIWTADGTPIAVLPHAHPVQYAVFSQDGQWVFTLSRKGVARRWNAQGEGEPTVLTSADYRLRSLEVSPDGRWVAAGSLSGAVLVWSSDDLHAPRILRGHTAEVLAIAFSPDSRRLISGSRDATAWVWALDGSASPVRLLGHALDVIAVAFSPDGTRVATTSRDLSARVWNADGTGQPEVLLGHTHNIQRVMFSPDGARLVTGSMDTTARVWDLGGASRPLVLGGHDGFLFGAAFASDSETVVTAATDGTLRVWHLSSALVPRTLQMDARTIEVAVSGNGSLIGVGTDSGQVWVWPLTEARPPRVLHGFHGMIRSIAFSPDDIRIAATATDGTARIWRLGQPATPRVLNPGAPRCCEHLAFSPDGESLALSAATGALWLWRPNDMSEPIPLTGHERVLTSIEFSPDGQRVLTGSGDYTARLWRTADGAELTTLRGHRHWVVYAAFSPDGQRVATASYDGTARIWPSRGDGPVVELSGHTGELRHIAFSPDGQRVVTASNDRTARVWRTDGTGKSIVLAGHTTGVRHAEFNRDGTRILTVSSENVAIWRADGAGLPVFLPRRGEIMDDPRFSPSGSHVIVPWSEGRIEIWETPQPIASRDQLHRQLWAATSDCLSVQERQDMLGVMEKTARENFARCQREIQAARGL